MYFEKIVDSDAIKSQPLYRRAGFCAIAGEARRCGQQQTLRSSLLGFTFFVNEHSAQRRFPRRKSTGFISSTYSFSFDWHGN
jgi:hypothetical protein